MAIVWSDTMFQKWYQLPNAQGNPTTYSRVGFRYYRGPDFIWGYGTETSPSPGNFDQVQYPFYPMNEFRYRTERLVANLGITPGQRILVLGCGFGFLPETFIWWKQQNGLTLAQAQAQIAGIDNSTFISAGLAGAVHSSMSGKVITRSLLEGSANTQMRNQIRQSAGGSEFFDWVITESVIESYTDAERAAFITACESYQRLTGSTTKNLARVVHVVFEDDPVRWGSPGWNPVPDGGAPNRTLEAWAQTRPQNTWVSAVGDMRTLVGTG